MISSKCSHCEARLIQPTRKYSLRTDMQTGVNQCVLEEKDGSIGLAGN